MCEMAVLMDFGETRRRDAPSWSLGCASSARTSSLTIDSHNFWNFFCRATASRQILATRNYIMSDSDSDGGVPLIEAQFDDTASSKKRKREAEPDAAKDKKAAKKLKQKLKKKQKAKEIDEDDLDQELGVNHSFERMDGQLVADYVNARTRLYGKELSSVELEDKFIPGKLNYSS
jgi:hypothetical protein